MKLPTRIFWLGVELGVGLTVGALMVGLGVMQFVGGLRASSKRNDRSREVAQGPGAGLGCYPARSGDHSHLLN